MASRVLPTTTLLLLLNLVFFTFVSSTHDVPCPPPPHTKPHKPVKPPKPTPAPKPKPTPCSKCPVPTPPTVPPPTPPTVPPPTVPTVPPPTKPAPTKAKCPKDTLKLAACANVLNLGNIIVGSTPKSSCCSLIGGLADLDAALCLCTAIKANVLGINLNIPVSLSVILNYCDKKVPSGFQCP